MKIDNTFIAGVLLIVVGVLGLVFISVYSSYRGRCCPMNMMDQGMMEDMMGKMMDMTAEDKQKMMEGMMPG
jgi:hypothetical protein